MGSGGGGTYDSASRGDSPGKNPKGGSWYSSGIEPQSFWAKRRSASIASSSSSDPMGISPGFICITAAAAESSNIMEPGVGAKVVSVGTAASVSVGESE